jgi:Mn-containing catalase
MFKHENQLLNNLQVKVEGPNPQYAVLMQEQLGGGNGELKAALQYLSQSFRVKDPAIKDLFLDIGTEELSHMEIVGETINLLNGHEVNYESVGSGEIQTHVLAGLAPVLVNSSGAPWTGNYVTVTGDLVADLLSNIASEQRAKVVYQYLYRQIKDKEVRNTIDFLLNREEAHNGLFREALNKVKDTGSNKDFGVTEDSKLYFDLSSPGKFFEDPDPSAPSFNNPRN